jgi:3-oxoadipate CoA-transferase beta subunit
MTRNYVARTPEQMAQRVIEDIHDGAYVNLGIGRPMLVANYLPPDKDIILHSENGVLGMGKIATGDDVDPDYVNAGKQSILLRKGAALFHHADSFSMIRGGHIDICILGAFQVSEKGDLANWRTMDDSAIPAVGGAMDLARGAKQVFIMMEHLTKDGQSKLVKKCSYPLTAEGVVKRIYTDLATLEIGCKGFKVIDKVAGLSHTELETISGLTIQET